MAKERRLDGAPIAIRAILAKIARMAKRVSASDAKNNFGGLLDDVATLGRVDIVKHGRLVAVVLSPRAFDARQQPDKAEQENPHWGRTHMIPPHLARQARVLEWPTGFDDE